MSWFSSKPKGPKPPPPPPHEADFVIVHTHCKPDPIKPDVNYWSLDYRCKICGAGYNCKVESLRTYGLRCHMCGAEETLEGVYAWMRYKLRGQSAETCVYCFHGKDQHVDGKQCLFMATTYKPKGEGEYKG